MCRSPKRGGLEAYWREEDDEDDFDSAPAYGKRFGMSLHEFKDIREQFQLTEWELSDLARDAWTPIRGFLNAHNARRKEIIVPGKDIVIDECINAAVDSTVNSPGNEANLQCCLQQR